MTYTNAKKSNATIARERELQALKAIAQCGWLLTRHVAGWVYYNRDKHVATNKAQLLLKRLEAKKLILKRETEVGVNAWVLTRKGADFVNADLEAGGYRGYAHHGYDLGFLEFLRITMLLDFLCEKLKDKKCLGATGRAGLRAGVFPDLREADGFYIHEEEDGSYTVVGVLVVTHAREELQAKYSALLRTGYKIDLVGDARIVTTLRKRTNR